MLLRTHDLTLNRCWVIWHFKYGNASKIGNKEIFSFLFSTTKYDLNWHFSPDLNLPDLFPPFLSCILQGCTRGWLSLLEYCCCSLFSLSGKTTISNDGATIMKLLDVVHPAAKTLVDISLSQDAEVLMFLWGMAYCVTTSSGQMEVFLMRLTY